MQRRECGELGYTELAQACITQFAAHRLFRPHQQETCWIDSVLQDAAEQRVPRTDPQNPLAGMEPGLQLCGDIKSIEPERVCRSQEWRRSKQRRVKRPQSLRQSSALTIPLHMLGRLKR